GHESQSQEEGEHRHTDRRSRLSEPIKPKARPDYLLIQGREAPLLMRAACSRWKRPPRGGLGRASIAAFLSRRARCTGVAPGTASAGPAAAAGSSSALLPTSLTSR